MRVEEAVRILAGVMVLLSVGLAYWVSPWFLLLGVFVGVNLIQSGFSKSCPAMTIFHKLGLKK